MLKNALAYSGAQIMAEKFNNIDHSTQIYSGRGEGEGEININAQFYKILLVVFYSSNQLEISSILWVFPWV